MIDGQIAGLKAHLFDPPESAPCWARTELFFSPNPEEQAQAQAVCGGCPQQRPCLVGALQRDERSGVWGGVVFEASTLREAAAVRRRAAGHLASLAA